MIEKLRGVRDFYPEDYYGRIAIHDKLYETVRRYGFKEVCTPSIESLELFRRKAGDAIVDEIYAFSDKGGRDICLIPELTPSVARMVIQRQKELKKPVKWCSLSRHWRYERPQKGRQREFYQYNVDIFGARSSMADFEVIAVGIGCLRSLGLSNFMFHISNRKLLEAFFTSYGVPAAEAFAVVDKRGKVSPGEFEQMLEEIGVSEECSERLDVLLDVSGTISESIPRVREVMGDCDGMVDEALTDLMEVGEMLDAYGYGEHCMLDLSIVRGLAYYTDMVFEVFDKAKSMRSLFGGGRYDTLIERFDGQPMPAVGFAIGIPMLEILMKEEGIWPEPDFGPDYFIVTIGNVRGEAARLVRHLRENHTVEYDLLGKNMKNQLQQANDVGAKNVVLLGERDLAEGMVSVKDMTTGEQQSVTLEELYRL
jgi:histidyl-tRNA synthetase